MTRWSAPSSAASLRATSMTELLSPWVTDAVPSALAGQAGSLPSIKTWTALGPVVPTSVLAHPGSGSFKCGTGQEIGNGIVTGRVGIIFLELGGE
jgi:hypothetical protein